MTPLKYAGKLPFHEGESHVFKGWSSLITTKRTLHMSSQHTGFPGTHEWNTKLTLLAIALSCNRDGSVHVFLAGNGS